MTGEKGRGSGRYAGLDEKRTTRAFAADEVLDGMKRESSTIDHYEPLLIGEGGEHGVFTVADNLGVTKNGGPKLGGRETVVKIHRALLLAALRKNGERGAMMNFATQEERDTLRGYMDSIRASIRRMKKYFGDAVLAERPTVIQVPVSKELVTVLTQGHGEQLPPMPAGTFETQALAVVQERAPDEAFGEDSFAIKNRYLERSLVQRPDVYEMLNRLCIDNPRDKDCGDHLAHLSPDVAIFQKAESDPRLHRALGAFFEKAIAFSQETGDILDFIGRDNVRCYKEKDGNWRVLLIDARTSPGAFDNAAEAVLHMRTGGMPSHRQVYDLLNAINYVRFVNAAASKLGLEKRLKISSGAVGDMSFAMLASLAKSLGSGTPPAPPAPLEKASKPRIAQPDDRTIPDASHETDN